MPVILLSLLYLFTTFFSRPPWNVLLMLGVLAPVLIWATLTDLTRHVIPDTAVVLVAATGLGYPWLFGSGPDTITLGLSVLVIVILGGASDLYWRRHQTEALGLGDVKLIGAGTLVVGASDLWLMIALAAAGGTVAALLARHREEKGIPFGPFLAYAIFAVAAANGEDSGWY